MELAYYAIWKREIRFYTDGPSVMPAFRMSEGRVSLDSGLEVLAWRDRGEMFFVIWRSGGPVVEFGCHNGGIDRFWWSLAGKVTEEAFAADPSSPFIDLPDSILEEAQKIVASMDGRWEVV